ncbi:peroxidase family protein [Deinococcus soli (ex Cha et al. 2016)]|uniref:peroxidase family protein n=1 Tax=Deinococcus soli (ex Cha et al. 2016) TaxID=1309411 RepID=UPI00166D0091|nr:heme peroxidase family protein [Deinococcus soli (ex Cha et al. 2016)]GGB79194.1 hypothetical protein GCM10008019_39280 [Deinococcus soli (ex Cha et al. 2016)]
MNEATTLVLRGRVLDLSGAPLAQVQMQAFDFDPGRAAQRLGEGQTGEGGRFMIHASRRAAGGASEGAPEVFLVAHTGQAPQLGFQTGWVRVDGPEHDFGDLKAAAQTAGDSAPPAADEAGSEANPSVTPNVAPEPLDPSKPVGTAKVHGSKTRDFLVPHSPLFQGPFGRLFRGLPAWVAPGQTDGDRVANIQALAQSMVESPAEAQDPNRDNPGLPVAYTYFGQFVDHDITFDPTSSLTKLNDPEQLVNFRTPRFDLDNLYGRGPDDSPYLYDRRPDHEGQFVLGHGADLPFGPDSQINLETMRRNAEVDLPRNAQGVALIGDPRNDENIIVSQLQLAFLRLHNRMLDVVRQEGLTGREAFTRAQTLVRWHYQWVVLFDFLPRLVGEEVMREVLPRQGGIALPSLKFYRFKNTPFMPVEFSAAAYRFGHSMVRERYDLNGTVRGVPIFMPPASNPGPLQDLRGFRPLPTLWTLDWTRFVDVGIVPAQRSRLMDAKLSPALAAIPAGPGGSNALAFLNLLRGVRVGLPSGQAVARFMGAPNVWSNEQLGIDPVQAGSETPLWLYLLKEADREQQGRHLGWVGARIVAEVFVGLAAHDPGSFLKASPRWTPAQAGRDGGPIIPVHQGELQLRDLLRFAGVMP